MFGVTSVILESRSPCSVKNFGEGVAGMELARFFVKLVMGIYTSGEVDWNERINASGGPWRFWFWSKTLDCVSSVLQDFSLIYASNEVGSELYFCVYSSRKKFWI